ncbi:Zinc finger, C2H2-type/integrase, DNA-binding protein [Niveomyces insectorum RCEF 264]|uniref:Zinc finger, C2H2-type/integrase, DNA-binding protein n=1 Tax=Niveomyces insectorum RCEF 264 TaxID=1081102 RepID=A0A167M092_9HYPO|nr:Zinc finger, C2H2-type/integrase, DNA-binding protein [Niveomyces insectorum RCEF 264]
MQIRDASGRRVSLLNEDDDTANDYQPSSYDRYTEEQSGSASSSGYAQAHGYYVHCDTASSSQIPELLRSDSFDSQASYGPSSPLTPNLGYYDYARIYATSDGQSPIDDYSMDGRSSSRSDKKRPASLIDVGLASSGYHDEGGDYASTPTTASAAKKSSTSERPGKRYPCRYAEQFHCDKTFTTSGHASRHSKIHSAEKSVQCSYAGCPKKFTRSDNMKQHLETHFKKSSDAGRRPSASTSASAGSRRSGSSSKSGLYFGSGEFASHQRGSPSDDAADWSLHPEFDLPMRPSHGRGITVTSASSQKPVGNALDALVYAASQEASRM